MNQPLWANVNLQRNEINGRVKSLPERIAGKNVIRSIKPHFNERIVISGTFSSNIFAILIDAWNVEVWKWFVNKNHRDYKDYCDYKSEKKWIRHVHCIILRASTMYCTVCIEQPSRQIDSRQSCKIHVLVFKDRLSHES